MLISYILSLFLSIFLNLRLRDGMKAKTLIEHHYKTALRDCPCNNPLFLSFYTTLVGHCFAYGKEPHVWFRMQFSTTPSIYLDKQFFDWLTISSSVALVDSSLREDRHQCGVDTTFRNFVVLQLLNERRLDRNQAPSSRCYDTQLLAEVAKFLIGKKPITKEVDCWCFVHILTLFQTSKARTSIKHPPFKTRKKFERIPS